MKNYKRGAALNLGIIALILVVGFLAYEFGNGAFDKPGTANTPPNGTPVPIGSCQLGVVQTLGNITFDADKPSTEITARNTTVYLNSATGAVNALGTTTSPGGTYQILYTKFGSFSAFVPVTTTCTASIPVPGYMKTVDSGVTVSVFNTDGITANSGTSGNLSISSGGSGTFHVKMSQSAAYKHLTGDSGKFAVFMNVSSTNQTDYDGSQMSATFDNVPCVPYGQVGQTGLDNTKYPVTVTGSVFFAAVCSGDFAPNDGSIHDLAIKVQASNGINPGGLDMSVNFVGIDRYKNTITGKVELGAVRDDGKQTEAAAVQIKQVFVV